MARVPYAEAEEVAHDGTTLYALHQLTAADLVVLLEAIRRCREGHRLVLENSAFAPPALLAMAERDKTRLDTLFDIGSKILYHEHCSTTITG